MTPLSIGGITVDWEPGRSYDDNGRTEPSRAELRQAAVKQFQDTAARATRGELLKAVAQVLALVIQLRGVNGSAADTGLGAQLREAADFLEDL